MDGEFARLWILYSVRMKLQQDPRRLTWVLFWLLRLVLDELPRLEPLVCTTLPWPWWFEGPLLGPSGGCIDPVPWPRGPTGTPPWCWLEPEGVPWLPPPADPTWPSFLLFMVFSMWLSCVWKLLLGIGDIRVGAVADVLPLTRPVVSKDFTEPELTDPETCDRRLLIATNSSAGVKVSGSKEVPCSSPAPDAGWMTPCWEWGDCARQPGSCEVEENPSTITTCLLRNLLLVRWVDNKWDLPKRKGAIRKASLWSSV